MEPGDPRPNPGQKTPVDRIDDGEVPPYLTDVLEPGDELELRGPIGGYFVWEASLPRPLQLIAGGSGIVALRACCATGTRRTGRSRCASCTPRARPLLQLQARRPGPRAMTGCHC